MGNTSSGNPEFVALTEEIMEIGKQLHRVELPGFFEPFYMYVLETQDYRISIVKREEKPVFMP
jgi:hypothetical protein